MWDEGFEQGCRGSIVYIQKIDEDGDTSTIKSRSYVIFPIS
jgi:hypothetical protein